MELARHKQLVFHTSHAKQSVPENGHASFFVFQYLDLKTKGGGNPKTIMNGHKVF